MLALNLQNINGCAGTDPGLPTAGTDPGRHYKLITRQNTNALKDLV